MANPQLQPAVTRVKTMLDAPGVPLEPLNEEDEEDVLKELQESSAALSTGSSPNSQSKGPGSFRKQKKRTSNMFKNVKNLLVATKANNDDDIRTRDTGETYTGNEDDGDEEKSPRSPSKRKKSLGFRLTESLMRSSNKSQNESQEMHLTSSPDGISPEKVGDCGDAQGASSESISKEGNDGSPTKLKKTFKNRLGLILSSNGKQSAGEETSQKKHDHRMVADHRVADAPKSPLKKMKFFTLPIRQVETPIRPSKRAEMEAKKQRRNQILDRLGGVLGETSDEKPVDAEQADVMLRDSEQSRDGDAPDSPDKQEKKSAFTRIKNKARKMMQYKAKGNEDNEKSAEDVTSPDSIEHEHGDTSEQLPRTILENNDDLEGGITCAQDETLEELMEKDKEDSENDESRRTRQTTEEILEAVLQTGELEDTITGRRLRRRRQSLAKEAEIPETPRRGRLARRQSHNNGESQPDIRDRRLPGAEELLGAKRNLRRTASDKSQTVTEDGLTGESGDGDAVKLRPSPSDRRRTDRLQRDNSKSSCLEPKADDNHSADLKTPRRPTRRRGVRRSKSSTEAKKKDDNDSSDDPSTPTRYRVRRSTSGKSPGEERSSIGSTSPVSSVSGSLRQSSTVSLSEADDEKPDSTGSEKPSSSRKLRRSGSKSSTINDDDVDVNDGEESKSYIRRKVRRSHSNQNRGDLVRADAEDVEKVEAAKSTSRRKLRGSGSKSKTMDSGHDRSRSPSRRKATRSNVKSDGLNTERGIENNESYPASPEQSKQPSRRKLRRSGSRSSNLDSSSRIVKDSSKQNDEERPKSPSKRRMRRVGSKSNTTDLDKENGEDLDDPEHANLAEKRRSRKVHGRSKSFQGNDGQSIGKDMVASSGEREGTRSPFQGSRESDSWKSNQEDFHGSTIKIADTNESSDAPQTPSHTAQDEPPAQMRRRVRRTNSKSRGDDNTEAKQRAELRKSRHSKSPSRHQGGHASKSSSPKSQSEKGGRSLKNGDTRRTSRSESPSKIRQRLDKSSEADDEILVTRQSKNHAPDSRSRSGQGENKEPAKSPRRNSENRASPKMDGILGNSAPAIKSLTEERPARDPDGSSPIRSPRKLSGFLSPGQPANRSDSRSVISEDLLNNRRGSDDVSVVSMGIRGKYAGRRPRDKPSELGLKLSNL